MKNLTSIIANTRSAYVVTPVLDRKNAFVELNLEPVVAWKVTYDEYDASNDSDSFAEPITIQIGLPPKYAIYYSDSERWSIPEHTSGRGLDTLLIHFTKEDN